MGRITDAELPGNVESLRVGKAPGSDGIPNLVLKVGIAAAVQMISSSIQNCLVEGTFLKVCKRQSLVVLPKTGKPSGSTSA